MSTIVIPRKSTTPGTHAQLSSHAAAVPAGSDPGRLTTASTA